MPLDFLLFSFLTLQPAKKKKLMLVVRFCDSGCLLYMYYLLLQQVVTKVVYIGGLFELMGRVRFLRQVWLEFITLLIRKYPRICIPYHLFGNRMQVSRYKRF